MWAALGHFVYDPSAILFSIRLFFFIRFLSFFAKGGEFGGAKVCQLSRNQRSSLGSTVTCPLYLYRHSIANNDIGKWVLKKMFRNYTSLVYSGRVLALLSLIYYVGNDFSAITWQEFTCGKRYPNKAGPSLLYILIDLWQLNYLTADRSHKYALLPVRSYRDRIHSTAVCFQW